jgi:hypothetical protein
MDILTENPQITLFPDIKKTESGFEYYDKLPPNHRLAILEDFIIDGKRKMGMKFLIQWRDNSQIFQICEVTIGLNSTFLKPFLEVDRVFVENNS